MRFLIMIVCFCTTPLSYGNDLSARTSYCPQWSADGKQIIFYSQIQERWRILKVNSDGSNLTLLSEGPQNDYYPSFSPQNDRILFYSNRDGNQEIYTMGTDAKDIRRLTTDPGSDRHPRWSPKGDKIAYVCSGSVCVMNVDGSENKRLTDPTKNLVVSRISWSGDGSQIAFYSSNDNKEMGSDNQWSLFSVTPDTGKVARIDPEWKRDSNPHWSKSGKIVVDAHKRGSWDSEDGGFEIFVINPDGTNRHNLTANNSRNDWGASWSADGAKIAYSSGINDQYEIYVMNADGSSPRQITNLLRDPSFVEDTRDGRLYSTTRIGKQVWMTRNLSYASAESYCFLDQQDDCEQNGRLYTWESARNACLDGWRLPSDEDWIELETHLGMSSEEAQKTGPRGSHGARLRSGGDTGFEAVFPGYRRPTGEYVRRKERIAFWVSSEANQEDAWHRDLRPDTDTIYRSAVTKTYALSVRCLKN